MKRNTRRIFIIAVTLLAVLLCGTICFLAVRQDISYRIKTDIQAVFAPSFSLDEAKTKTCEMSLSDLQSDNRVVFDQSLMLINQEHLLADSFIADVDRYLDSDVVFNVCAHDAYQALASQVNKLFEQKLYIRSAYRSASEQQDELQADGDTATFVGASEHQAGLALDVYIPYYAGKTFLKTDVGLYVNRHCHEFGFIIRYPSYGQDSTGILFEPWHLRYVGKPHAEIITNHFLTLEEYIFGLELQKLYAFQSYIITRQSGDVFTVPCEFKSATVSSDHIGGYIFTFEQ